MAEPTPEPRIPISRRAIVRHDKRTAEQVDAHIQARAGALKPRLAARPIVRVTATRLESRIKDHARTLRNKHPEAPGS